MKITKTDILETIDTAKRNGIKLKNLSSAQIRDLVKEANCNSYYVAEEGLWAFVLSRTEVKEDK